MQDITTNLLKTAVSAHKAGDFTHAEALYRQVIELTPNNLEALHYLALLFITTDQPHIAIPLLTKAVSVKGDNPDILYNLGLAYQKAEDIDSAIHYYKMTIALNPDYALAYNNLGVAYQHLGKLDQANNFLEKAFTLSPHCAEAYYNFSQSYKFNDKDKSYINKIENLLVSHHWDKNEEIKLNFSLGKIYNDLKEYDIAFKYYKTANELKYQDFNTDQFHLYIDQIIASYTPELIQQLRSKVLPSSFKRFIFIVGMPRSGTTLVEQIIASHPSVQSAGEIGFIGDIVDDLPQLIQSNDSYPQCIQSITAQDIISLSSKLNRLIENIQTPTNIITDKTPINTFHIGLIRLLFPNSKIIYCNRNPIDTCLSCYFQNFEKQHQYSYNLKTLAFFYNENKRLMAHWKSLFKDEIYDVSYEDVVNHQEDETRKLLSACDLDWDDTCLDFYKAETIVNSASKWQVRRPIYKTSIKKWEKYESHIQALRDNLDDKT